MKNTLKTTGMLFSLLALASFSSVADDNTSGLVGMKEKIIEPGKAAPNGYVFVTSDPEHYTGIISYEGSSDGFLGMRGTLDNDKYASWEMRPPAELTPGKTYNASVSVKHTEFVDKQHIGIEVISFDADKTPTTLLHALHNNAIVGKWHTISGSFKVPENSESVRVRVDLTSPGELLFKDLVIGNNTQAAAAVTQKATLDDFNFTDGFKAEPGGISAAELPQILRRFDGKQPTSTEPYAVSVCSSSVKFDISGEAGVNHAMRWSKNLPAISMDGMKYYSIRYRASGILRNAPIDNTVQLNGTAENGDAINAPLLKSSLAFDDGMFHTIVGKIPEGMTTTGLSVILRTKYSRASLEIANIAFHESLPLAQMSADWVDGMTALNLDALYNASCQSQMTDAMNKFGILQDALPNFQGGNLVIAGIPFHIAENAEKNMVKPPFDDSANKETFPFMGETGTRKYIEPISRNDAIEIPVSLSGEALYLLLINDTNPEQRRYTLGPRPLRLDDLENISVELRYDDNSAVRAFPYSVEEDGFFLTGRFASPYAVTLDPSKKLEKAIIHFNSYTANLCLAAATISNTRPDFANYLFPKAKKQFAVQPLPKQDKNAVLENGMLKMNGFVFDVSDCFSLVQMDNAQISPASGLEIRIGNDFFTGRDFTVDSVTVNDNSARLSLHGKTKEIGFVQIALTLSLNERGGIVWEGSVINNGTEKKAIQVAPGAICGLRWSGTEDDMVFFPRMRTEISGSNASYRAAYGQEFLHQFMDFYNNAGKGALMLLVDNRANDKLEFLAAKQAGEISAKILMQKDFAVLEAGASAKLPKITWQPHGGDWHTAAAAYREFLSEFYKPTIAQNHDYFLNAMVNNCYHTTNTLSWRWYHVPPLLSKDKKTWYIDEVNDFETKHLGHKVDFIHLWWSYNDAEDRFQYGQWSSPAFYAQSGGLESFREAIRHYQEDLNIPVSLYTISDRVRNLDVQNTGFDSAKMVRSYPDGSQLKNETESYTCLGSDAWLDYAVADLAKLMKDTGAKILYSDVVSTFNTTTCHNPNHGHEVPANCIKSDLKFMSRLRKALPEDASIWTEYPQPDTTSMYSDGAISYYFQELQYFFAPVCDISDVRTAREFEIPLGIVRFLIPTYKIFPLPVGMEAGNKPSQIDAVFFNGEAFHEDTWFMHESNARARLNKALDIKKQYMDCFMSASPEAHVQTLTGSIYANRFPGKGRTLWTLFNAAAITAVDIPAIAIPHVDGAKYLDVWNDTAITPEIVDGMAIIRTTIDPQHTGAVVQLLP